MADLLSGFESECVKTLEYFKGEIGRLRGGRASASLLEGVMVDYYGSSVPLSQLGNVSAPEPRMLSVQVYDSGAVENVEKAIQQADLGLNPSSEGNLIRVVIPALTEERRKALVKKLHEIAENARVSLRGHRRATLDELKRQEKDKEITEDDLRRNSEDVQKRLDIKIKDLDQILQAKEAEMMEV